MCQPRVPARAAASTLRMPSATRSYVIAPRLPPHVIVADLERPRERRPPCRCRVPTNRLGVEVALAGRHPVAEAVVLVVGERRRGRAVAHLDAGDQLGWDRPDEIEVVRAAGVVPDVDAHSAVRPIGAFDDGERVGGVDDVREREELEADDRTVVGGPVAERAEVLRRRRRPCPRTDRSPGRTGSRTRRRAPTPATPSPSRRRTAAASPIP